MKTLVAALVICCVSCLLYAKDRTGRLYNLKTGEVSTFTFKGRVHGNWTFAFVSGERMQGEFSTIRDGSVAWGSIYGSGGTSAQGLGISGRLSARGSAVATGNKGTILSCEYVTTAKTGNGKCKDNHDVIYTLMF